MNLFFRFLNKIFVSKVIAIFEIKKGDQKVPLMFFILLNEYQI